MISSASTNRRNSTNNPRNPPYGSAQAAFIKKTRSDISAEGASYFKARDWTNLVPVKGLGRNVCLNSCGAMCADAFYVKPVAAWIPHLLLPDHVPQCPTCDSSKYVDITSARWTDKPKLLYGVGTHRYLDTMMYKCLGCNRSFTGYNEKSLQLDSAKILGVFNYHLSAGFAVDDALYSFITNHSHDTTASIYKRLALSTADKYLNDSMFYYKAMEEKKVKARNKDAVEGDKTQRSIRAFVAPRGDTAAEDPNARLLRIKSADLARLNRELNSKRASLSADIKFSSVLCRKSNRNNLGQVFKGIGRTKLELLINHGITSARELLAYEEGDNPLILPSWRRIIQAYYEGLEVAVADLESRVETVDNEVLVLEAVVGLQNEDFEDTDVEMDTTPDSEVDRPPPFSKLTDPEGFNARCIPKATIDRIIATDFQHREKVQDAKMRNIPATVLKIDFHYKIPSPYFLSLWLQKNRKQQAVKSNPNSPKSNRNFREPHGAPESSPQQQRTSTFWCQCNLVRLFVSNLLANYFIFMAEGQNNSQRQLHRQNFVPSLRRKDAQTTQKERVLVLLTTDRENQE